MTGTPCSCTGPLHDFTSHLRARYGRRVAKVGLSLRIPCPHRGEHPPGCLYCHPHHAPSNQGQESVLGQFARNRERVMARYGTDLVLAYFQDETSTAAPPDVLCAAFSPVMADPAVVGLVVSTRPDCVDDGVLSLLADLQQRHGKPLWLEMGLQSCNDETLRAINRGHDAACFAHAARRAHDLGLKVGAHTMLGLPGEGVADMVATHRFLAGLPVDTVKMHHVQVYGGTGFAKLYGEGKLKVFRDVDDYIDHLLPVLSALPWEIKVQRVITDGKLHILVAPRFGVTKNQALARLFERMAREGVRQGDDYR